MQNLLKLKEHVENTEITENHLNLYKTKWCVICGAQGHSSNKCKWSKQILLTDKVVIQISSMQ